MDAAASSSRMAELRCLPGDLVSLHHPKNATAARGAEEVGKVGGADASHPPPFAPPPPSLHSPSPSPLPSARGRYLDRGGLRLRLWLSRRLPLRPLRPADQWAGGVTGVTVIWPGAGRITCLCAGGSERGSEIEPRCRGAGEPGCRGAEEPVSRGGRRD